MTKWFLKLYDWLSRHRKMTVVTVLTVTLLSVISMLRLHYEEDIAGFLPIDRSDSRQTGLIEQLSQQNSIAVIFRGAQGTPDDDIISAMDLFEELWYEYDTLEWVPDMSAVADESMALDMIRFVEEHWASFLTPADYRRMDSLLSQSGYVERSLEADKRSLQMVSGSFTASTIPIPML